MRGMIQIWFLPLRELVKARYRLSGENDGLPADLSPWVYCRLRSPSAVTIQTWLRYSDFSPSISGLRIV